MASAIASARSTRSRWEASRSAVRAPIPGSPIVVRKDLDPALLETIRGAILGYSDPAGLLAMQVRGFVPVDDATYAPVRRLEALRDESAAK